MKGITGYVWIILVVIIGFVVTAIVLTQSVSNVGDIAKTGGSGIASLIPSAVGAFFLI